MKLTNHFVLTQLMNDRLNIQGRLSAQAEEMANCVRDFAVMTMSNFLLKYKKQDGAYGHDSTLQYDLVLCHHAEDWRQSRVFTKLCSTCSEATALVSWTTNVEKFSLRFSCNILEPSDCRFNTD